METQMPKDVQVQTAKWKRIGDILMDSGLITREQMKVALQKQAVTGKRLGTLLIDLGFISEENMVGALSRQLGVPSVDLKKITVSDEVLELLPFSFFLKHEILPLEKNGDVLKVAMVNPLDRSAIDEIGFMIGCAVQPLVTTSSALQRFLKNRLASDDGMLPDMDEPVEIMKDQIAEPDMIRVKKTAESRSVAGTLGKILWDAVKSGATSIHINPRRKDALLRYRIDGFLQHEMTVSVQTREALLYRLKQMAGMVPDMIRGIQQGTAQVRADARTIDLRVSTLPTLHGEKVVIRLLDKSRKMRTFESLGMHPRDLSTCYTLLAGSPGLVLLSGPVGSGITTTLYAIIHYLRSEQNNIITLEDPVEYEIPGISQVQITPGTGISFEDGIRAALNQDPDVMMVSDIRNPETALLLFEAALRGHRVFSSIHANDAVSALDRIIRMDTPACLAASALSGIAAQRLVRRNCPHCMEKYIPEPRVLAGLRIDMKEISKMHFYRGRGCKQCNDTGYSGQTGLYEILPFDPEIRDMVFRKAASQEIFRLAREKGMTTMEENGLYLVLNKITTLEELLRVIPSDGIVSRRKGPWEEEIISLYDDAVYVL